MVPLTEPAALGTLVVVEVLLHRLGLGVPLEEALGDQQRGVAALRQVRQVPGLPELFSVARSTAYRAIERARTTTTTAPPG